MRYMSLYLDHAKIGCGWRPCFVVKEGRIKTRLFFPADCQSVEVPNAEVRKARDIPIPNRRAAAKVAAVIRDNFKQRKRLHLAVAGRDAKAVMEDLKKVAA
jgi:hypothetical protein